MLKLKRAYEPAQKNDGLRILVDRLWPRGISKAKAKLDLWLKDIGPSTELRKWFGHDPKRWKEFVSRYNNELNSKKDDLKMLKVKSKRGAVTLVYGARDKEHNEALVIENKIKKMK
jgi:uncharacterized protein YeaO (DUF488 family)